MLEARSKGKTTDALKVIDLSCLENSSGLKEMEKKLPYPLMKYKKVIFLL